jgi:hypothetical protein
MNWHFTFFLFNVVVWIGIALLLSFTFAAKSHKDNFNSIAKLYTIIIALCAGFFSVLTQGLPEMGFSINSFMYAFLASLGFVFYQLVRTKKRVLSKRYMRIAHIKYAKEVI